MFLAGGKRKFIVKKYKAIFFDWDGTAVVSRKASADQVAKPMKRLLAEGVKLAIISGTTMENIAGGRLHEYFTPEERRNLFLGLGRGAYNYGFDEKGQLFLLEEKIPVKEEILKIHDICYEIHRLLLQTYEIPTDIVFSRPNYCKIDLMVGNQRGDALFLQEGEREELLFLLEKHGFRGGIKGMIALAERIGKEYGMDVSATTDAKYLGHISRWGFPVKAIMWIFCTAFCSGSMESRVKNALSGGMNMWDLVKEFTAAIVL